MTKVTLLRLNIKKPKSARKKERREKVLKAKAKEAKHKAELREAKRKEAKHKEAKHKAELREAKRKEAKRRMAAEIWVKHKKGTKTKKKKARFIPWKGPDILGWGQKTLATSLEESGIGTET